MRTNSIGLFLNNLNNWHLYEFKPWLRTAAKCSYSLQWNQSCEMKLIEAEHTVVIYADLAGYCYHSFNASCNICLLQVSWHWKWRKIMSKSDCLCTYCSVSCLAFGAAAMLYCFSPLSITTGHFGFPVFTAPASAKNHSDSIT